MKRKLCIYLTIFVVNSSVFGQNFLVGNFSTEKAEDTLLLYALNGIDGGLVTPLIAKQGSFRVALSDSLSPGMFLLERKNDKDAQLFFIYDNETVKFTTNQGFDLDSTVFKTNQNKLLKLFDKEKTITERKIQIVNSFLKFYPEKDEVYKSVEKKYSTITSKYNHLVDSIKQNLSNSYLALLIRTNVLFIPNLKESLVDQISNYKETFWDNFPFDDQRIVRSDAITMNVRKYLFLYANKSLTLAEQNEEYKKAIVELLSKEMKSELINEVIQENIHSFFLKYGNMDMVYFMDKNYISNSCESSEQVEANERMSAYERTQPGKEAPVIEANNLKGDLVEVTKKETNPSYTIVYFWASTCEHCKESMPELKKMSDNYKAEDIRFVGVSLDVDEHSWKTFIEANELNKKNILNLNAIKGWKSKVAKDFGVISTPTYFIINKEWEIEKRPSNLHEIERFLKINK